MVLCSVTPLPTMQVSPTPVEMVLGKVKVSRQCPPLGNVCRGRTAHQGSELIPKENESSGSKDVELEGTGRNKASPLKTQKVDGAVCLLEVQVTFPLNLKDRKGCKQPVSINRWMDKEDVVYMCGIYIYVIYICGIHTHTHTHTHREYYSAIKKDGILPYATVWMDLEGIMLSEISQTEKVKYFMLSLICGI